MNDIVGWANLFLTLGATAVCAMHLRVSRFMWVLLAGFTAEAAVSGLYRLLLLAIGQGITSPGGMGVMFAVAGLAGLVAKFVVVAGLTAVLMDVAARPR